MRVRAHYLSRGMSFLTPSRGGIFSVRPRLQIALVWCNFLSRAPPLFVSMRCMMREMGRVGDLVSPLRLMSATAPPD